MKDNRPMPEVVKADDCTSEKLWITLANFENKEVIEMTLSDYTQRNLFSQGKFYPNYVPIGFNCKWIDGEISPCRFNDDFGTFCIFDFVGLGKVHHENANFLFDQNCRTKGKFMESYVPIFLSENDEESYKYFCTLYEKIPEIFDEELEIPPVVDPPIRIIKAKNSNR